MTVNLIHLLIGCLVFGLIAYVARPVLRPFAAQAPGETIVLVILLILLIVWLLGELGVGGPVIRIGEAGPGIVRLSSW